MTDKEKIREEVVGIINSINLFAPDEDGKNSSYEEGRLVVASQILQIIDSLEEPVSNPIDFEQELYKAFGQVKDFTLGMRIAKWFYDMGKNSQEPVGEDLEKASDIYGDELDNVLAVCSDNDDDNTIGEYAKEAFKAGANWQEHTDSSLYENTKKMWEEIDKQYDDGFATGQKLLREQMLKEAFEVPVVVSKIGEKIPSIAFGMPYSNYKDGDKVKLIIIKED